MIKLKILQIDAWADGDEGWTWNNWFHVNDLSLSNLDELDKVDLDYLVKAGVLLNKKGLELIDDGYNLVVVDKKTQEPFLAVEFGPLI